MQEVSIVGGGLAGSECALQLASRGVKVKLFEMRPNVMSPAHHSGNFAELVCSNSLKSTKQTSAAGILKQELEIYGSRLLKIAYECRVDAGGALACDRDKFSEGVTRLIEENSNIEVTRAEVTDIPSAPCVIAAGPLASDTLSTSLQKLFGSSLSFFDAASPIVDADSIDMNVAFRQSRYDEENLGDYLNCPMDKSFYENFIYELTRAEKVVQRDFEQKDLFQACQPVEEVARTGLNSLRFGALKPVGLTDPSTGRRPWAAVQLRAENAQLSAYNMVGFQTNLTFGEQARVFRLIPGLKHAEFFRYGVMHRNSFIDSPHKLDSSFAIPHEEGEVSVRFAGQITGTEGYTEAIASGLLAAINTYEELCGRPSVVLPADSVFGALTSYACDPKVINYQPMHVNFGLMPPLPEPIKNKQERMLAYAKRAISSSHAFASKYL